MAEERGAPAIHAGWTFMSDNLASTCGAGQQNGDRHCSLYLALNLIQHCEGRAP